MIKLLKVCGAYNEYSGLSTDDLPTDAPENSLLLLLDTNKLFYFINNDWIEVGQSPSEENGGK